MAGRACGSSLFSCIYFFSPYISIYHDSLCCSADLSSTPIAQKSLLALTVDQCSKQGQDDVHYGRCFVEWLQMGVLSSSFRTLLPNQDIAIMILGFCLSALSFVSTTSSIYALGGNTVGTGPLVVVLGNSGTAIVGTQAHALLTFATTSSPAHASLANSGTTCTSSINLCVKLPQNSCEASSLPSTFAVRIDARQESASQTAGFAHSLLVILTTKLPRSMVCTKMKPLLKFA